MNLLSPLLAFLLFLVLALFYAERGIKSSLAPLCALCSVGVFLALLGMLGFLFAAGVALYVLGIVLLLYLLYRFLLQKKPLPNLEIGFWAFALSGFVMLVVLGTIEPMFITWDEFSTWGTGAKLMKLNHAMYTTAEVGWIWTATQPPLLACLSYFVQFFGSDFVEWQHYAAINLLQLAAIAAILSPLEKKHWTLAMPLALTGFLTPYLFTIYAQTDKLTAAWVDSLADVPMGFLFGAVLAAWFGSTEERGVRRLLPSLLSLFALTLTKDTALALGLVAAVLIVTDSLAQNRREDERLCLYFGKIAARILACFTAVLLPFFLWAQHLSFAADINRFELGGVRNAGMSELFLLFFRELFSAEQSEHFQLIVRGMPEMFFSLDTTMIGSGAMASALILALVALAAVLAKPKELKRRCLVFGLFSTLGFLPYFLLIMITYLYVFRPEQAFESFERYLAPYYIGWFLAAMALLAYAASHTCREKISRMCVMGFSLLFTLRVWMLVPPAMSVVGFNSAVFEERYRFESEVRALTQQLDPEGKTFIISVNDTGFRWFMYCYSFLPWQVDYSYGGGAFEEQELQEDGTRLITPIDEDAWQEHLRENEVSTVFIDEADEAFMQEYGSVFSDGMDAYFEGETQVYEVHDDGENLVLRPTDISP